MKIVLLAVAVIMGPLGVGVAHADWEREMVGASSSLRWLDATSPVKNAESISDRALLKQIEMGERFASECCMRPRNIGIAEVGLARRSFLASLLFVIAVTPPQAGAKALFDAGDIRFVGVHYWFEDSRGQKFADPAAAGIGAKVTLHLRSNVGAFLTVWMSDATHDSVELTSRSDAGPEGKWTGQRVAAGAVLVVSGGFVVVEPGKDAQRIAIFLGRSQTEQVGSFAGALEKLARIAARKAGDGESVIVREVDRTTPGQIGTYVVHRGGGQTGGEIIVAVTRLAADSGG